MSLRNSVTDPVNDEIKLNLYSFSIIGRRKLKCKKMLFSAIFSSDFTYIYYTEWDFSQTGIWFRPVKGENLLYCFIMFKKAN